VLNLVLLGLGGAAVILGLADWIGGRASPGAWALGLGVLSCYALAYWLGRRGYVRGASWLAVSALGLTVVVSSARWGVYSAVLLGYAVVVVVTGILIGVRAAGVGVVLALAAYVGLGVQEIDVGFAPGLPARQFLFVNGLGVGVGLAALAFFNWLAVVYLPGSFQRALAEAHRRELALVERVAEQEKVNADLRRDNQATTAVVAPQLPVDVQEDAPRQVSNFVRTPVIPVWQGVVVMPLTGQIKGSESQRVAQSLLRGIEREGARVAIVDITAVPAVDEQTVQVLLQVAQAAELMGCQPVLTGLRPEFAQALITLGIDTARLLTRSDLEGGMAYALGKLGFSVSRKHGLSMGANWESRG